MDILQWLKEMPPSRSAFAGNIVAVIIPPTLKLEIAVLSMCISLVVHRLVTHATVALGEPEKNMVIQYLCVVSKPQHFTKTNKAIEVIPKRRFLCPLRTLPPPSSSY